MDDAPREGREGLMADVGKVRTEARLQAKEAKQRANRSARLDALRQTTPAPDTPSSSDGLNPYQRAKVHGYINAVVKWMDFVMYDATNWTLDDIKKANRLKRIVDIRAGDIPKAIRFQNPVVQQLLTSHDVVLELMRLRMNKALGIEDENYDEEWAEAYTIATEMHQFYTDNLQGELVPDKRWKKNEASFMRERDVQTLDQFLDYAVQWSTFLLDDRITWDKANIQRAQDMYEYLVSLEQRYIQPLTHVEAFDGRYQLTNLIHSYRFLHELTSIRRDRLQGVLTPEGYATAMDAVEHTILSTNTFLRDLQEYTKRDLDTYRQIRREPEPKKPEEVAAPQDAEEENDDDIWVNAETDLLEGEQEAEDDNYLQRIVDQLFIPEAEEENTPPAADAQVRISRSMASIRDQFDDDTYHDYLNFLVETRRQMKDIMKDAKTQGNEYRRRFREGRAWKVDALVQELNGRMKRWVQSAMVDDQGRPSGERRNQLYRAQAWMDGRDPSTATDPGQNVLNLDTQYRVVGKFLINSLLHKKPRGNNVSYNIPVFNPDTQQLELKPLKAFRLQAIAETLTRDVQEQVGPGESQVTTQASQAMSQAQHDAGNDSDATVLSDSLRPPPASSNLIGSQMALPISRAEAQGKRQDVKSTRTTRAERREQERALKEALTASRHSLAVQRARNRRTMTDAMILQADQQILPQQLLQDSAGSPYDASQPSQPSQPPPAQPQQTPPPVVDDIPDAQPPESFGEDEDPPDPVREEEDETERLIELDRQRQEEERAKVELQAQLHARQAREEAAMRKFMQQRELEYRIEEQRKEKEKEQETDEWIAMDIEERKKEKEREKRKREAEAQAYVEEKRILREATLGRARRDRAHEAERRYQEEVRRKATEIDQMMEDAHAAEAPAPPPPRAAEAPAPPRAEDDDNEWVRMLQNGPFARPKAKAPPLPPAPPPTVVPPLVPVVPPRVVVAPPPPPFPDFQGLIHRIRHQDESGRVSWLPPSRNDAPPSTHIQPGDARGDLARQFGAVLGAGRAERARNRCFDPNRTLFTF